MTATDEDLQPVRIHGTGQTRDTTHDRFPFYLGDDDTVLIGTRPKMATLIDLVGLMSDETDELAQVAAYNEFLDEVLDADSVAYLRGRFRDRDDLLDLDHPEVQQMFRTLVEVWYGKPARPTGGRPGSAGSPARTGRRSTARARSQGSTR